MAERNQDIDSGRFDELMARLEKAVLANKLSPSAVEFACSVQEYWQKSGYLSPKQEEKLEEILEQANA